MIPSIGYLLFWEHLTFNTDSAMLADRRVRLALCEGFDLKEVYAKVVHGIGDLGTGEIHPRSSWYNRSLASCRFDPDHARLLLDQAGWKPGPDGIRQKDGKPLQISFATTAGSIDREQMQVLLQSRWRAIGVDAILKSYPPATLFAPAQSGGILYGGKFDVALSAYSIRSIDPNRINFRAADTIPPAGQNLARWRNQRVTQLEYAASRTFDDRARKRMYDEIQQIEAAEVPYVTLRWWTAIAMHDVRLKGVRPAPVGSTFWNVAEWTF